MAITQICQCKFDIIDSCQEELAELLQPRPQFAVLLDDLDPHVCARVDLVQMIEGAPSPELRMYLYAIFQFREMLALAIGAKF